MIGREGPRMQKTIDGVRIAYDIAGSGEALVLVHGFPLDRTIWDAQFAALARRCRVIRLDLRGSGESGSAAGPALMETLAGDVFGLLAELDVKRAIIAGHSIGGYVALAFFRMYAERVLGLALIASEVCADPIERRPERDALAAAVEAHGVDAAVEACLPDATAGADRFLVAKTRAIMARQSGPGAAAQIRGMKERVGAEDLLEDLLVPVTIVGGESDPCVSIVALEATAAAIGDCEFVPLRGVGHLPMLEAPDAVTAALERLIDRCAASAAADPQNVRATRA